MRIYLSVVTSHPDYLDIAGSRKSSLFPAGSLRAPYDSSKAEHVVNAFDASKLTTHSFADALRERANDCDRLLVLYESRQEHLLSSFAGSALCCPFETDLIGGVSQNYLASCVGKLLRALRVLDNVFHNQNDAVLLALPFKNFHDIDLRAIKELSKDITQPNIFSEEIQGKLKNLRKRVRPRKNSSSRTRYAVDDKNRFFVFGNERHSRHATGGEHLASCDLKARFRLGFALQQGRHYNVSMGEKDRTNISGQFHYCHGDDIEVPSRTHLNMFSNDYF